MAINFIVFLMIKFNFGWVKLLQLYLTGYIYIYTSWAYPALPELTMAGALPNHCKTLSGWSGVTRLKLGWVLVEQLLLDWWGWRKWESGISKTFNGWRTVLCANIKKCMQWMEMEIICGMRILGHEMEVPLQRGNPAANGKSRCKGEIHRVNIQLYGVNGNGNCKWV